VTDEHDPFIPSISDVLRPLPAVDGEAKARVLLAIAAERERDRWKVRRGKGRSRMAWFTAAAVAASVIIVLGVSRRSAPAVTLAATNAVSSKAAPAAQLAANDAQAMDVAALPVQLVLHAPDASRVAVVGDFNGWSKEHDFMTRDAASGLWSTTLRIRPGRHVYAFVVNDTQWVRDPRALPAPDADFGRPGSVLLVGKP
jgi:hypothetical protein